jgi:hypothetical protein
MIKVQGKDRERNIFRIEKSFPPFVYGLVLFSLGSPLSPLMSGPGGGIVRSPAPGLKLSWACTPDLEHSRS